MSTLQECLYAGEVVCTFCSLRFLATRYVYGCVLHDSYSVREEDPPFRNDEGGIWMLGMIVPSTPDPVSHRRIALGTIASLRFAPKTA